MAGKITLDGVEFEINEIFQQNTFMLADEIDLDEQEAARCLLDSQEDIAVLGRSLLECGIIRFHQQRKYALDAFRLLLELGSLDSEIDNPELEEVAEAIKAYIGARLFTSGSNRLIPRCMSAMGDIKAWLQKIGDKIAAAQTLGQAGANGMSGELETVEFSRVSLVQQHELLGVILCRSIEQQQGTVSDFLDFITTLKKVDKYDTLLGKSFNVCASESC
jgi:nuclear pore complex protein Nup205